MDVSVGSFCIKMMKHKNEKFNKNPNEFYKYLR